MRLYQVDAFTGKMFAGNPAGVCIQTADLPRETMQDIAAEMNLSETAFVRQRGLKHELRWFTPETEVDLCGHATLAAAHVMFNEIGFKGLEILYETRSGQLVARKAKDGVTLDFPAGNPQPAELPEPIFESLGVSHADIRATLYCNTRRKYLVHLKDPTMVVGLKPDFGTMMRYSPDQLIGVIVTAKAGRGHDIISRFFAPWVGVNEDPVTGSAHTVLAPYWAKILGKNVMTAYQASKRGGEMRVELAGARVLLTGQAVTVFATELEVP